jgi:shikimate dehydrogenase
MGISADSVYTLADLDRQSFSGTPLAVIGHPITHSLSPVMHNAALAEMAHAQPEFASWRYYRFEVPPRELLRGLDLLHQHGFHGLNLTVPHKVIALQRVTELDPQIAPVGAVNTLLRTPSGWRGYNTDGHGLATAVREELGVMLAGAHVILLGAGGAARSAAVECLRQRCASLWIANRTRTRLEGLLAILRPLAALVPLHDFEPQSPPADLPAGTLVINATAAGLRPDDPSPLDLAYLPPPAGVYDMIYNPPETPLLRQAATLGVPHANGLSMLVHQGAKSLEIWTGARVPVEVMRRAARAALESA